LSIASENFKTQKCRHWSTNSLNPNSTIKQSSMSIYTPDWGGKSRGPGLDLAGEGKSEKKKEGAPLVKPDAEKKRARTKRGEELETTGKGFGGPSLDYTRKRVERG